MQNYSIKTYAETFPRDGKKLSRMTIHRMIENNQLPTRHVAKKIGKVWVIQVFDYSPSELCDTIAECCEVIKRKNQSAFDSNGVPETWSFNATYL